MSSKLKLLRKIYAGINVFAEELDQTVVGEVAPTLEDKAQDEAAAAKKNKDIEEEKAKEEAAKRKAIYHKKWTDKYKNTSPEQFKELSESQARLTELESLPVKDRMPFMREMHELRDKVKKAHSIFGIQYQPDTGTFVQTQSKEQESFEEKILHKAGVSYPKYLNRGEYSKVYLGIYEGNTVVAKLTQSQHDVNATNEIIALKNKLPTELATHVLHIYNIVDIEFDNEKYSVIITERLNYANSHVRDLLSNLDLHEGNNTKQEGIKTRKDSIGLFLKQNDDVIEEFWLTYLIPLFGHEISQNSLFFIPIFKKRLSDLKNGSSLVPDDRKAILKILESKMEFPIRALAKLANAIYDMLKKLSRDVQMPYTTKEHHLDDGGVQFAALAAMPETKSFIAFLMYCLKHNWIGTDLNRKNIMEREDHTLVIADIGTLKQKENPT